MKKSNFSRGALAVLAVALVGFALFRSLSDSGLTELRNEMTVLRVERDSLDVQLTEYTHLRSLDSAYARDLEESNGRLQERLTRQAANTGAATVRRDSLAAGLAGTEIDPRVLALVHAEREVAVSALAERDILADLLSASRAYADRLEQRLDDADRLLILTVGQRDTAMDLVERHEDRLRFRLFGNLKGRAVCATGGALTAATMKGNILIGAGIGLAACVIGELIQ